MGKPWDERRREKWRSWLRWPCAGNGTTRIGILLSRFGNPISWKDDDDDDEYVVLSVVRMESGLITYIKKVMLGKTKV